MNINEVIEKIGKDKLKDFEDFMSGQTVGVTKDGLDYYPQDVDRFIWQHRFELKKMPRKL